MYENLRRRLSTTSGMVAITSLSSFLSSVLAIIGGLFVAKLLLPEELGLFNSFSIFTSYIILTQIGIPSGLSRELPFYLGKKDSNKVEKIAESALHFSLTLSIITLILSLVISAYFLYNSIYKFAFGSFIIGITSFQAFYVTKYLKVLYRSNTEFNKLAVINLIGAFFSFLSIFFVWKYGFYGLGIRVFIFFIVDLFLSYYWRPIKVKPKWSYTILKELFTIGIPIYFVASIYGLWPTIQRTVILALGGVKALGLFALAFIVQNMLTTINNSISSVSFPKMTYAYGEGAKFKELMEIPKKFVIYSFVLYLFVALIGWYLLPIIVEYLLPNYSDGVPAAQWMLIAVVFSVFGVFSNVYMVIQKNMDRLKAYTFGIIVWAILVFLYYKLHGFDLVIFPIALTVGYIATYTVDIYFYTKYTKLEKNTISL